MTPILRNVLENRPSKSRHSDSNYILLFSELKNSPIDISCQDGPPELFLPQMT